MKRGKALALALLLLFALHGALAAEPFPALNERGFLDSGEFLSWEDPEEGSGGTAAIPSGWRSAGWNQKKPARVWYEAEIRCAGGRGYPAHDGMDPENG